MRKTAALILASVLGLTALLYSQSNQFPNCVQVSATMGALGGRLCSGTGTPEAAVTGWIGDLYLRRDGGAGTTLYIKESGAGTNTGWATVATGGGVSAPVPADQGGTGQTAYAVGDLLYASGTTALSKRAAVAAGSYLRSAGTTTAPVWSTLILPNAATATRLTYATATNTFGEDADLTFDGSILSATGGYKERSRTTSLGEWITPTYAGGTYTGAVSMTWTVDAGDVSTAAYTLVGKTLTYQWVLNATAIGGTPSLYLQIAIPGGFTAAKTFSGMHFSAENGSATYAMGPVYIGAGTTVIRIYKPDFGVTNWVSGVMASYGSVTFEVQ